VIARVGKEKMRNFEVRPKTKDPELDVLHLMPKWDLINP